MPAWTASSRPKGRSCWRPRRDPRPSDGDRRGQCRTRRPTSRSARTRSSAPSRRSARARASAPHVVIAGRTRIGAATASSSSPPIGEIPQDRKYGGEPTTHDHRRRQRRSASTCRSTPGPRRTAATPRSATATCSSPTRTSPTTASSATTRRSRTMRRSPGTCIIGDWVVIGAYAGVHQFCRVGAHAMLAAGSIVLQDVPPLRDRRRGIRPSRTAPTTRACAGAASRPTKSPRSGAPTRRSTAKGLSLEDARARQSRQPRGTPALRAAGRVSRRAGRGIVR